MKSVNYSKPGYTSINCSKIEHIPYNLIYTTKYNDCSILITIISWDYLNLSLANEYIGNVTTPTQVIKYIQCGSRRMSQSNCSIYIKLNYYTIKQKHFRFILLRPCQYIYTDANLLIVCVFYCFLFRCVYLNN